MTGTNNLIEVRTFHQMSEVEGLSGFKPNNPVDNENYQRIIGDYEFDNKVKCCFKKTNGNMCVHDHKYGFVAMLKDESVTLVGNVCAKEKFGADAQIKRDRSKYMNEKRRIRGLISVRSMYASRDEKLGKLNELLVKLRMINTYLDDVKEKIGHNNTVILSHMGKTRKRDVTIGLIKLREGKDEDGNKYIERQFTKQVLGVLKGSSIFVPGRIKQVVSLINNTIIAYAKPLELSDSASIKEIESVSEELNKHDYVMIEGEGIIKMHDQFFENELTLLCFISPDKSDRYKMARFVMGKLSLPNSRDKAKRWLAEVENELKRNLKVDQLKIAA